MHFLRKRKFTSLNMLKPAADTNKSKESIQVYSTLRGISSHIMRNCTVSGQIWQTIVSSTQSCQPSQLFGRILSIITLRFFPIWSGLLLSNPLPRIAHKHVHQSLQMCSLQVRHLEKDCEKPLIRQPHGKSQRVLNIRQPRGSTQ